MLICVADMIEEILCMQQIGAILSIDEKLFLVHDEAVRDCMHRLFLSCHFQILRKMTVYFIEFLVNIKTTNSAKVNKVNKKTVLYVH